MLAVTYTRHLFLLPHTQDELTIARAKIKTLESKLTNQATDFDKRLAAEQKSAQDATKALAESESKVQSLTARVKELDENVEAAVTIGQELDEEKQQLCEAKEELEAQVQTLEAELDASNTAREEAEAAASAANEAMQAAREVSNDDTERDRRTAEMQADIDSLQRRNAELFNSLSSAEAKIRALEDQGGAAPSGSRFSAIAAKRRASLAAGGSSDRMQVQRLQAEVKQLKERLSHSRRAGHGAPGTKDAAKLRRDVESLQL